MCRIAKKSAFVLLVTAAACTDKPFLTGINAPLRTRSSIVPPSGAVQLGTNDSSPAASGILPSYPDPIIVQVGVSGTISMTSAKNTWYSPYNGPVDGSGIFVDGWQACYVNVTFSWSGQGRIGPGPCRYPPIPRSTWGDTVLVSGNGTVTRGPGVPQDIGDCDRSKCHTYSGFQSTWVLPLHADLRLMVYPDSGMPGAKITFSAGVNPLSFKNIPVPIKLLSWQWSAAGGGSGQTVPCAQPVTPCVVTVMESGTMQLTALINGEEQTASANVGIFPLAAPCPAAVLPNHPLVTTEYYAVDASHPAPHVGRDLRALTPLEFKSARDGIVVQIATGKTTGLRVIVQATDGSNRLSYYYHLQDVSPDIHERGPVAAGQVLGHTGHSGGVSPHLHFEEHINAGYLYDPATRMTLRNNLVQPCTF